MFKLIVGVKVEFSLLQFVRFYKIIFINQKLTPNQPGKVGYFALVYFSRKQLL